MTRRNQAIIRSLLTIAVCGALCATGHAQTSGDPHNWDVGGIRLGISVEQAQAALHAHDPSMKVQVLQSPSQVGKGTFTSVVVGATGSQGDPIHVAKSDAILIAFTETEGNRAYSITRVLTFPQNSPGAGGIPTDVLTHQLVEKYGKPHSSTCSMGRPCDVGNVPFQSMRLLPFAQSYSLMFWNFGPDGQPVNVNACATAGGAPIESVTFRDLVSPWGWSFPTASMQFPAENQCGIGLAVVFMETQIRSDAPCGQGDCFTYNTIEAQEMLVDAQLQYRDLTNIDKIHKDAEAKRLEDLKAKAQQEKSPF